MRFIFLCVALILQSGISVADVLRGRVVGITDGDTVTVLVNKHDQYRIRVEGIDAPEKKQAFGQQSKEKMSELIYGKDVTVQWKKKDRYGRTLGIVFVDGQDAGLSLLRAGLAWHYKKYQREQSQSDRELYGKSEDAARVGRVGLWADNEHIPPWEWRHSRH